MPATEKGKEFALNQLKNRRENMPEKINNASLPMGSYMYFYCIACGQLSHILPESYTCQPKELCDECQALKTLGWLE